MVFCAALLMAATWSLGAMALTAMPLYPWLTRFSRIWFCSSTLPLAGILISTCTPASFSYFRTPAWAIFQNSLALLVTNASFRLLPDLPLSQPTKKEAHSNRRTVILSIVFITLISSFLRVELVDGYL